MKDPCVSSEKLSRWDECTKLAESKEYKVTGGTNNDFY